MLLSWVAGVSEEGPVGPRQSEFRKVVTAMLSRYLLTLSKSNLNVNVVFTFFYLFLTMFRVYEGLVRRYGFRSMIICKDLAGF